MSDRDSFIKWMNNFQGAKSPYCGTSLDQLDMEKILELYDCTKPDANKSHTEQSATSESAINKHK